MPNSVPAAWQQVDDLSRIRTLHLVLRFASTLFPSKSDTASCQLGKRFTSRVVLEGPSDKGRNNPESQNLAGHFVSSSHR
jgi:hypothetical protein